MKRIILAAIALLCFSLTVSAQTKFVYDNNGTLKYYVSDSLIVNSGVVTRSNASYSEWKIISSYRMASHIIGYMKETCYYMRLDGSEYTEVHRYPMLFGKLTDCNSLRQFVKYIELLKIRLPNAEKFDKFSFNDSTGLIEVITQYFPAEKKFWLTFKDSNFNVNDELFDKLISAVSTLITKFETNSFED